MRPRALLAVAAVAGGLAAAALASAQKVDPKRPRNFVVGEAKGPSTMARVDPHRSGFVRGGLPQGPLRIAWRKSMGASGETTPLVTADGDVVLVSGRGDVYVLGPDGDEKYSALPTGVVAALSPALLADGTVVITGVSGDVVGVRAGAVRFRTRIVGDRSGVARISPLPTADGGILVGGGSELVLLDADGGVRARSSFPEPVAGPVLAAGGKVIVTSALGAVYTWSPGREPVRLGSFGAPCDGGAVVSDDERALLAVVEGNRIAELDLARGVTVTRASAPPGGALLGPPALRGTTAYLLGMIPGRTFALALDASGQEVLRAVVSSTTAQAAPDGGGPVLVVPPHAGVLVDGRGTAAFVSPDGRAGTVSSTGAVDTVPDSVCGRASQTSSHAPTLAPGRGAFYVACPNGTLAKIVSEKGN
jgi:outer membrane protein assembly factor BamB